MAGWANLPGVVLDPAWCSGSRDRSSLGRSRPAAPVVNNAGRARPIMRLAVIVPTLDERENLDRHLPRILALGDELVVSDGGSSDGTVEAARRHGARVVEGDRGRGIQLNRGAAASDAEILLFLHADSLPPPGAAAAIRQAVAGGAEGGAFRVRFEGDGLWTRLGSRLVNLRTRLTRLPLGDQGQFVTRAVFEELGGYRDWPILEDLDFARRLRRRGRLVILAAGDAAPPSGATASGASRAPSPSTG